MKQEQEQQEIPVCVFHRHEVLDESEFICACEGIADVRHVLGLQNKQDSEITATEASSTTAAEIIGSDNIPAASYSSQLLLLASPIQLISNLALHETISMTASYASFSSRTRCHTVEKLSEVETINFWQQNVIFTAQHIFRHDSIAMQRRAMVVGVFITQSTKGEFTVGLITQGIRRDQRLQSALTQFRGIYKLTREDSELSICASRRGASVRLWWEPRSERVTPYHTMAPIKVIIETQSQQTGEGELDEIPFCGYAAVNIFLCRPAASHLCGTTYKILNNDIKDNIKKEFSLLTDNKEIEEAKNSIIISSFFSSIDGDIPRGIINTKEQEERSKSIIINFDNLSVIEEGEHLVGVEVQALPSYKAFIPTLYGHLAPFLVVAREDA